MSSTRRSDRVGKTELCCGVTPDLRREDRTYAVIKNGTDAALIVGDLAAHDGPGVASSGAAIPTARVQ